MAGMMQPAGFERSLVGIHLLHPRLSFKHPRRSEHDGLCSRFMRERYRLRRTRLDGARESRDVPVGHLFNQCKLVDITWRGTYDTKPERTSTSGLIGAPAASIAGSRLKTARKDAMVSQTEFSPMCLPGHTLKTVKLIYYKLRCKMVARAYRRPAPNAGRRGSGTDGSSSSFPSTSFRKRSGLNTSGSG
jgi:hypothetical protein